MYFYFKSIVFHQWSGCPVVQWSSGLMVQWSNGPTVQVWSLCFKFCDHHFVREGRASTLYKTGRHDTLTELLYGVTNGRRTFLFGPVRCIQFSSSLLGCVRTSSSVFSSMQQQMRTRMRFSNYPELRGAALVTNLIRQSRGLSEPSNCWKRRGLSSVFMTSCSSDGRRA